MRWFLTPICMNLLSVLALARYQSREDREAKLDVGLRSWFKDHCAWQSGFERRSITQRLVTILNNRRLAPQEQARGCSE